MPKGFSDKQRERIANSLVATGKELFSQYGLKKTSIADITKAVGISQGSFYSFYRSKEMLFYTVIKAEEEKIRERLMKEVDFTACDVKENLKELMFWTLELIEENTLIQQLFSINEMETIMENIPKEATESHMQSDKQFLSEIIAKWQKEELLINEDTEVIVGLFRALFILPFSKKSIGESNYKRTIEILVNFIAEGLIRR